MDSWFLPQNLDDLDRFSWTYSSPSSEVYKLVVFVFSVGAINLQSYTSKLTPH